MGARGTPHRDRRGKKEKKHSPCPSLPEEGNTKSKVIGE
jgi:hypothetical protein